MADAEDDECACVLPPLRALETLLYSLGALIFRHEKKLIPLTLLLLGACCAGLLRLRVDDDMLTLFIEEGGRLEKELAYTTEALGERSGMIPQVIQQLPRGGRGHGNVTNAPSLLYHVQAVLAGTRVQVRLGNLTWTYEDVCEAPEFPKFHDQYVDGLISQMMPCAMISPLDCFWEGAKPRGPSQPLLMIPIAIPLVPISPVTWKNLNGEEMVSNLKQMQDLTGDIKLNNQKYLFETLIYFYKSAGIKKAFVGKPCLNPLDGECPIQPSGFFDFFAPEPENVDVAKELTGGCLGFGENFMIWPQDMLVGGVTMDNTSTYIKSGKAIQTLMPIKDVNNLYEFWHKKDKVANIEWTPEVAQLVLQEFQKNFSAYILAEAESVNQTMVGADDKEYTINVFNPALVSDVMDTILTPNMRRLIICFITMLVYSILVRINWSNRVQSCIAVGLLGVFTVVISTVAGLGLSAAMGITANPTTTQVIPFLLLTLGFFDIYLFTSAFTRISMLPLNDEEKLIRTVQRVGVSIILTYVSTVVAFFIVYAFIYVPALRAFALQAAIMLLLNMISVLILIPSLLSLDSKRRHAHRFDCLCCVKSSSRGAAITKVQQDESYGPLNGTGNLTDMKTKKESSLKKYIPLLTDSYHYSKLSMAYYMYKFYGPLITKVYTKVIIGLIFLAAVSACGWSVASKVTYDMSMVDIVPEGTNEHKFLVASSNYFSFRELLLVTKDNFDYASPKGQNLIFDLHTAMASVDFVVKRNGSAMRQLWFGFFRDWLKELQNRFDEDLQSGYIQNNGWSKEASRDAILAYKLLMQNGNITFPSSSRLVSDDGAINPGLFYYCLTAWVSNDPIVYKASKVEIRPKPVHWIHDRESTNLTVPRSEEITYSQMVFFVHNLNSSEASVRMIKEVRALSEEFIGKGLPNFPRGMTFTFYEQFIRLPRNILVAVACVLCSFLCIITLLLFSPRTGLIVVFMLTASVTELLGVMGFLHIKVTSIHALIIVLSLAVTGKSMLQFVLAFLHEYGSNRNERVKRCITHMFAPLFHTTVSTILIVLARALSPYEFVVKYLFLVLTTILLIAFFNTVIVLPVLLSLCGPNFQGKRNKGDGVPVLNGDNMKELDDLTVDGERGLADNNSSAVKPNIRVYKD